MRRLADLPATAELVVIGAGVIGAATAFAARRAGIDAVVLEARPRGGRGDDGRGDRRLPRPAGRPGRARAGAGDGGGDGGLRGVHRAGPLRPGAGPRRAALADDDVGGAAGSARRSRISARSGSTASSCSTATRSARGSRSWPRRSSRRASGRTTACSTSASSRSACSSTCRSSRGCRVTGFDGRDVVTTRGTISAGACVIACGPMSGAVARARRRLAPDRRPSCATRSSCPTCPRCRSGRRWSSTRTPARTGGPRCAAPTR